MTGSAKQSMPQQKERMDCFVAALLAMTALQFKHIAAFSRREAPGVLHERCPPGKEGAGNAGCTLHPRSRVQSAQRKTHTSIQVQRRQSGIPCAMALRLMPCSPRRRIRLVTVAAGLMALPIRSDRISHRQLDTSNGCQDHTVLPYASASFVLRAGFAHERFAPRCRFAPTLPRPPHPTPRS
jgi:hypothetical protein